MKTYQRETKQKIVAVRSALFQWVASSGGRLILREKVYGTNFDLSIVICRL
jgi:hypothetical protein